MSSGEICHHHPVRMPGGLLVNGIDQIKRVPGEMALIGLRVDPDGKKSAPRFPRWALSRLIWPKSLGSVEPMSKPSSRNRCGVSAWVSITMRGIVDLLGARGDDNVGCGGGIRRGLSGCEARHQHNAETQFEFHSHGLAKSCKRVPSDCIENMHGWTKQSRWKRVTLTGDAFQAEGRLSPAASIQFNPMPLTACFTQASSG